MTARAEAVAAVAELAERATGDRELLSVLATSVTARTATPFLVRLTITVPHTVVEELEQVTGRSAWPGEVPW